MGSEESVKPQRVAVGKKLRFDVFKRDGFVCQYCGAFPPMVILHVDHVIAVADGGVTIIDNLVTACEPCNLGKGARPLTSIPETMAAKALRVAEQEAQVKGYQKLMEKRRQRLMGEVWFVLEIMGWSDRAPSDYLISVRRFIERLGFDEVRDAAEISLRIPSGNGRFQYLCGVCWSKIRMLP